MTQADWVKEFDALYYGSTCGGDGLFNSELFMDIKAFISKVESSAQQRTEKKWRDKYNEAKLDKLFSLDRDHSNEYQLGVKETFASLDYDLLKPTITESSGNRDSGESANIKTRNKYRDKLMFGGMRESVLKRDNYQCVKCGMTNEEHMDRYQRGLSIDHINGLGSNVPIDRKDNRLENLQTLCLYCHGKKDNKQSSPKSTRVAQFSLKGELIKKGNYPLTTGRYLV